MWEGLLEERGEMPRVPQQGLNPDAGSTTVSHLHTALPSLSVKWERKPTSLETMKLVHNKCQSLHPELAHFDCLIVTSFYFNE